jgi:hypothetical protein
MRLARIGSGSETLTLTTEEGAFRPDELVCELRAQTMSASRIDAKRLACSR